MPSTNYVAYIMSSTVSLQPTNLTDGRMEILRDVVHTFCRFTYYTLNACNGTPLDWLLCSETDDCGSIVDDSDSIAITDCI